MEKWKTVIFWGENPLCCMAATFLKILHFYQNVIFIVPWKFVQETVTLIPPSWTANLILKMKWTSIDISLSFPLFLFMIVATTLLTNFLCVLKAVSNYWKYKVINTWVCCALSWPLQAGRMNLSLHSPYCHPLYQEPPWVLREKGSI